MPESKTQTNLLFYCTLVLTHLYRDTLGLIQGGGTHRSWPGGRGGRPRALIPEKGEGLAWWTGGQGGGASSGGGCKGFGSGGVGGRDTGPRDGANFATCVVFLSFLAMAIPKKGEGWGLVGCSKEEQVQGRGQGRVGLAVGGGARASVASFLTRRKRRNMFFFEGPCGVGGVFRGIGGKGWVGTHLSWLGGRGVREAGQGLGEGCKGFGSGGGKW